MVEFKFDWVITHWMVGISFSDRYNTLLSIGPLVLWIHRAKRLQRDMENTLLQNMEELSK